MSSLVPPVKSIASTLESVTIYREGAICVRRARVEPQGDRQLRFGELPLSLEPGSIRARVVSGAPDLRVLDVRPQFDVQLAEEVDVPAEQKALEAAQDVLAKLQVRRARLEAEIEELENLRPRFLEYKRGDPPRDAPVTAMLALGDLSDAELGKRLDARRAIDREIEDAENEVALRQRRLNEASTAQRTERARLSRVAVVMLSAAPSEACELTIEYQVPGVRWVPNYQLKLERGMASGTLHLRASIAQSTGEDWNGISLSLSTASLARRTDVPELKALKIGRRQEAPPRSGWREPPPGLDELFEGYDNAMQLVPPPSFAAPTGMVVPARAPATKGRRQEVEDRRELKKKAAKLERTKDEAPGGPPRGGMPPPQSRSAPAASRPAAPPPPPAPMAMPASEAVAGPADMLQAKSLSRSRHAMRADDMDMEMAASLAEDEGGLGGYGGDEPAPEPMAAPETTIEAGFLDYSRLVMMGVSGGGPRGRLSPGSEWDFAFLAGVSVQINVVMAIISRAQQAAYGVNALGLPANCNPVHSVNSFDYRYDCAARVDIPSTGKWTTVPVMNCAVGLTPEYVCVPSVEQKVYRTLTIANRSVHALLPGPVDVTAGDEFLLTTSLPAIPPGTDKSYRLGLGVEEAIKVARKTQYKETSGGFLGGSTVLPHDIEIELNNRLGSPALIEVRERVPWADPSDKDLKIEEPQVVPPWEKVEAPVDGQLVRGARRWRVTVPPGQTMKLTAQFTIRMPADQMIVGGNRRV